MGVALLSGAGAVGVLGVVALVAGVTSLASAGAFYWARSQYHTKMAFNGLLGTAVTGGSLLCLAAVLLVLAVPVAGLGAWALAGVQ